MDHNRFETNMIDFVNRNAQTEEKIRNENLREEQKSAASRKRKMATKAIIEIIFWVLAIPGIVAIMSYAEHCGYAPTKVAIIACSLFAYIGGVRLNTLTLRIKKYGGR